MYRKMQRAKPSVPSNSTAKYSKTPGSDSVKKTGPTNNSLKPGGAVSKPLSVPKKTDDREASQPLTKASIGKPPLPNIAGSALSVAKPGLAPPGKASPVSKISSAGGGDSDARKMIGELPVLLQDLSTSKLLLKFKQESSTTPNTPPVSSDTPKQAPSDSNSLTGNNKQPYVFFSINNVMIICLI